MKIKSIQILGLFGLFDYNLRFGEDSRYLILTSPNGYGKTTILSIINSIAKADLYYFYWLSFRNIKFSFEEGALLTIDSIEIIPETKEGAGHLDVPAESKKEISFRWTNANGTESRFVMNEKIISKAFRSIGFYEGRMVSGFFPNSKEFREFVRDNPKMLDFMAREQNSSAFFLQIKSINAVFVEAQRIFSSVKASEQRSIAVHGERTSILPNYSIDEVAVKIKKTLLMARYHYLEYSQSKNNQLIYRLLNHKYKELSEEEYQMLRSDLLFKSKELVKYGLIEGADIPEYNEAHGKELSAHIAEIKEKFGQLDDVYSKVKLFSDLIGKKHFTAKTISFSREKGLRAVANDQKWLELSDLSSGEQNVIVMLYYLVFEYNKDKLLLIDEPEISLHVAWQYQYIEELEEILKINDGQAIIATHSPQIIGERWDKCIDLTEQ